MKYFILLSLCLGALVCFTTAQVCSIPGCTGPNQSCCLDQNNNNGNPTCYDTTLFDCNGGTNLCPKGLQSCGKDCFDPAQYSCFFYGPTFLIQASQDPCRNLNCFNRACCPIGSGTCFQPNREACTIRGVETTCFGTPSGSSSVCLGRGRCIGPNICECFPGFSGNICQNIVPGPCNCAIPTDLCCNDLNNNNGNPVCYSPTTHQCNGGNRLCPIGRFSCGKDCYDPNTYDCNGGVLVPK